MDIQVNDFGFAFALTGKSTDGQRWLDDNLDRTEQTVIDGAIVVEKSFFDAIFDGATDEGIQFGTMDGDIIFIADE